MHIDVIIPTFNRASILKRSIESVLNQSYKDFTLTVVDDGSTDNTEELIKNYPQVKYLKQDNRGVSAARNLGIKNATSNWVAFLDSDDEWLPHKLEAQVKFLKENPKIHFVHSNEIWIRNGVRVNPKVKFDKSSLNLFQRSLETCLISPSTVLMKKDLAQFDETMEICEDYDLWLKILAQEDVGFIEDNLIMKYGGHEDQLSTKYPAMDYWRLKSLIKLFTNGNLSQEKKEMVKSEAQKKAPILLRGLQKHNNLIRFDEITELMKLL